MEKYPAIGKKTTGRCNLLITNFITRSITVINMTRAVTIYIKLQKKHFTSVSIEIASRPVLQYLAHTMCEIWLPKGSPTHFHRVKRVASTCLKI